MGYQPRGRSNRPTRESFHLGMLRSAYLADRISVDEFEDEVAVILRGEVPQHSALRPLGLPRVAARPGGNVERR